MKKISIYIVMLMLALPVIGQTYSIKKYILGSSSNSIESQEYKIKATAGQPAVGTVTNDDNILKSGFWYGFESIPYVKLLSPANGALALPINVSLIWQGINSIPNYQVQISENEAFDNPIQTIITADTFTSALSLNYNTKYFWRVRPYPEENYKWSEVRTFTTRLEIPQNSALVYSTQLLPDFWTGTNHKSAPLMLELRSGASISSSVLYKRSSAIVNTEGIAVGRFDDFQTGNYWLVVRAAGYAAVCSNSPINISAGSAIAYDFSRAVSSVYQPGMLAVKNGRYVFKAGDLDANRRVMANDMAIVKPNLGLNSTIIPAAEDLLNISENESGQTILNVTVLLSGQWVSASHKPAAAIVELRSGTGLSSSQLYKRANGIISSSGTISVSFNNLESGQYWLVVRSAGYASIASAQKLTINANESAAYDFSNSAASAYYTTMLLLSNGRYLMKAGDYDGNMRVNSTDIGITKPNIGANTSIIPAP